MDVKSYLSEKLPGGRIVRLTSSPEFERVYRRGLVSHGRLLSVHTMPNDVGSVRLGLSVSKKVGSAVVRNVVRRRLKEIFRLLSADIPEGIDVVVSVRPAAADAGFDELSREFARAMRKLRDRGLDKLADRNVNKDDAEA